MTRLIISPHPEVLAFAKARYGGEWTQIPSISPSDFSPIPENAQVFGNLPIALVGTLLAKRPDIRYYQIMVPRIKTYGYRLPHLIANAYIRRYHVEEMETFEPQAA